MEGQRSTACSKLALQGAILGESLPSTDLVAVLCQPWGATSRTHRAGSGRGAHLVELLVTVRALVLLVGVVSLQVAHLGGGVREGAATVVALVGLLATVHQLVALEVAGSGEELATVPAAVARLPRVPLLVQVQQADEPVALATLLTPVRFQRAVEQKVLGDRKGSCRVQGGPQSGGAKVGTCVSSRGPCTLRGLRRPCCTPGMRTVSHPCGCGCGV